MKFVLPSAVLLLLAAWGGSIQAADLQRGYELSKSCALCHGVYGQGTTGRLSPRIAGLPAYYTVKAMKDYVEGKRLYPLMVRTSRLDQYTEEDFEAVAAYYASLDLGSDRRFDIKARVGDEKAGKRIFRNCRSCHGRDGYGRERKEAPPLAGQHPEYLFTSMRNFKDRVRMHANDPDDETFADYDQNDFINITAFLATLDDERIKPDYRFVPPRFTRRVAMERPSVPRPGGNELGIEITDIKQTVVRMPLDAGVTVEQAEEAMLAKAEEIGQKFVARQKVSSFLAKQGVDMPHLSIFQFCNPMDARLMVIANPIFSSYMPCRVSMVEDGDGKIWVMMLNLDMLINSKLLNSEVVETAIRVNQQMLDIMAAGASGGKG